MVGIHVLLSAGKSSFVFKYNENTSSFYLSPKVKMDRLKFKLEMVEALSTSPPINKRILTVDENNRVVIALAKRSKRYNLPAVHAMAFILAIPE
ncbi:hypothetical protein TNCV_1600191 [Trichonephila clavipes]|nr:hypothetical protein TNCV_1600191 [Trichonephila clavipes]